MLDTLFTFPVVMIDEENEMRKIRDKEKLGNILNSGETDEFDVVFGEAEYPYFHFIGIEDRWIPNPESFQKAIGGKFEACAVKFLHAGQLLVPWSRKKFKNEFKNFVDAYEAAHPITEEEGVQILNITPEQFKKMTEEDGDE